VATAKLEELLCEGRKAHFHSPCQHGAANSEVALPRLASLFQLCKMAASSGRSSAKGNDVARSLQARLFVILVLLIGAALASSVVMLTLFRQSNAARIGQASAVVGRSCGAIAQSYRFYTAGWVGGARSLEDDAFRQDLGNVVFTALRDRENTEGGLWQAEAGVFAYAFPTYEGTGPKTDVPAAEVPRIVAAVRAAQADDRLEVTRVDTRSQSLLLAACPLSGPVIGLVAWTMTRVHSAGGATYLQLLGGLTALLIAVAGASIMVTALITTWSRHVRRIESTLATSSGDLPTLPLTGERELDRIISTLNDTGRRLSASRLEAERLAKAIAEGERLAAVGRVAAGVAHEIRSPIAAMRLKAEMALSRAPERKDQALQVVIDQVDRLNALVTRLLTVAEREPPRLETVDVPVFLDACVSRFAAEATQCEVPVAVVAARCVARFDPGQMERAVTCLLANARQADPSGAIVLRGGTDNGFLVISVTDHGPGPPEAIRDHLFDPFVTGRAESAGLGLSIVREIAEAHNGTADYQRIDDTTVFRVVIPWLAS
jgi:signal transduction histidine kinase